MKEKGVFRLWRDTLISSGLAFMFWFRLEQCDNVLVKTIARIIRFTLSYWLHINIDRHTQIGYGFFIVHGGPVVINVSAKIGNNVDMYQFSTIGSSCLRAATIEDEVYIGPSVCIVEDVHIGKGATIGAGAVVVKDVPAGATAAGVPAKVISHKEPGRFIRNKWKM